MKTLLFGLVLCLFSAQAHAESSVAENIRTFFDPLSSSDVVFLQKKRASVKKRCHEKMMFHEENALVLSHYEKSYHASVHYAALSETRKKCNKRLRAFDLRILEINLNNLGTSR